MTIEERLLTLELRDERRETEHRHLLEKLAELAAAVNAGSLNEQTVIEALQELGARVYDLESGRLVDVESRAKLDEITSDVKAMTVKLSALYERAQAARSRPPKGSDPLVN
jgi:hypothetical protein